MIWSDGSNKQLKSSRKKPENIKKGDVVVIPPNPADRSKIKANIIAHATASIAHQRALAAHQAGIATELELASKHLSNILKSQQAGYRDVDYLLADARKSVKKVADGVDLAKDLIDLTRGLKNLAKNTKESFKLSGDALKEANSKAAEHAVGMVSKSAKMLGDTVKNSVAPKVDNAANFKGMRAEDRALKSVGSEIIKLGKEFRSMTEIVEHSYDNIQKPSFVALAVASLMDGKSWSASMTRNLDDELKQLRLRQKITMLKSMGRTSRNKAQVDKQAKIFRDAAKDSLLQAKAYEKNLATYRKL